MRRAAIAAVLVLSLVACRSPARRQVATPCADGHQDLVLVARVVPEWLTAEHLEATLARKARIQVDLSPASRFEGDLLVYADLASADELRRIVEAEAREFGFLLRPSPGPAKELLFKLRHTIDAFTVVDPHSDTLPLPRDVRAALDAATFIPSTVSMATRRFRSSDGVVQTATLVRLGQPQGIPWTYVVLEGRVLTSNPTL